MKQKLELFSPTNEGELVNEATYLKQILTFAQQEWKGITMTEPLLRKVWAKVKAGTYFDDSPADEVAQLYEKMDEDYKAAKELIETYEEPAIGNDNQPEVSEESQEKLELVQSVTEGLELSSFTQKFDLGAGMTQCVPKGKVDAKDWVKAFAFGLTLESGSQWIIGDAVVALEDGGHEDVVNQLCAQFKKSYSTVSGYARTSRSFAHDKRDPMLPFTVYREIGNADLTDKKRFALLDAAKEEKLSSQEVRGKVREAQGKQDEMKPLPHRYLLLNVGNFGNSECVRKMPAKILENQLLIDMQGKAWFDPAESEWINFAKGE
jgi:hypothetical protein